MDWEPAAPRGMLLGGWKGIAQAAAMAVIAAGAGAAIYAERATVEKGLAVLPHLRVWWLLAGIGAECLSMLAFGQLQRGLLRAGGAKLSLGSVLATVYRANAIAVAVPVIGSGIATAYLYRDFRRSGAQPAQVTVALTVAGILSSVAFAVVVAAGALVTGNPAAAVAALAGAAVGVAAAAVAGLALRFPVVRSWLVARVAAVLTMVGGLRLGWDTAVVAFGAALVNWLTDVACLVCALKAAGAGVPWSAILIVWTAGAGAASFSPSPAGLGVVDIVLIAALAGGGDSGCDRGRRRGALPDSHVQDRHYRGLPRLLPPARAPGPGPELTPAQALRGSGSCASARQARSGPVPRPPRSDRPPGRLPGGQPPPVQEPLNQP